MKPDRMETTEITQRNLEEFKALRGQQRALNWRVARERERLLRLVDAGAPVESGRLRITVDERFQQRITRAALVALIGVKGYERLRSEVPPTAMRYLAVGERARVWASPAKGEDSTVA